MSFTSSIILDKSLMKSAANDRHQDAINELMRYRYENEQKMQGEL